MIWKQRPRHFKRHAFFVSVFALHLIVPSVMTGMTPGHAQDGGPSGIFSRESHDTNQPIEITSDSLEVKQEEQVAIFNGNVDAMQGALRLKADKLEVHYVKDDADAEENEGQTISSMRALGHVFVTSPGETAQGDWADYDVTKRTLTLHDNVLLTQGKNVLCGKFLDMELDTGRSFLRGACARSSSNKSGRVQGVFFPKKSKK